MLKTQLLIPEYYYDNLEMSYSEYFEIRDYLKEKSFELDSLPKRGDKLNLNDFVPLIEFFKIDDFYVYDVFLEKNKSTIFLYSRIKTNS